MLSRLKLLSFITLTVLSSSAIQAQLALEGEWFQNRGPVVDLPINGGPTPCGANDTTTGCVNQRRPRDGGITGYGLLAGTTTSPGQPAGFIVPVNAFHQANDASAVAIATVPTAVQLDTHFSFNGPVTETGGPNIDRVFGASAWVGQSGRLAATFAWCPGVGGPACGDPRPVFNGHTGLENGLIKYSALGGNAFGGTMAMLVDTISSNAQAWIVIGTAGDGTPLLLRQPISGSGRQHPGAGYAVTDTDMVGSGTVFSGFMTSMQTPGQTGLAGAMSGLITSLGPQINTAPASTIENVGMPWTTGQVIVQDIETNLGALASTTITLTGSDSRTLNGSGNITLVAGGTSFRTGAGINVKAMDIVTMTMPEPAASLMFCVSLAAIAIGYSMRPQA